MEDNDKLSSNIEKKSNLLNLLKDDLNIEQ